MVVISRFVNTTNNPLVATWSLPVTLSLESIAAQSRAHRRTLTTRAARAAQRALDESALADYYARRRALRESLDRALGGTEMDAMRFRWLCQHPERLPELAGATLDQSRRTVDLWQRQEAAARIAELHNGAFACATST